MSELTLRQCRDQVNKTAQKIADDLGIARSTLYRIEDGDVQASPELAEKILAYYREFFPDLADLAVYNPRAHAERVAA